MLRTAAQAWIIPATDATRPKTTVRINTSAAIQNVYHWTFFRSSCHHWETVWGSESSKACFRTIRRSLQYRKLLIWRFAAFKCPHEAALGSSCSRLRLCSNHSLDLASDDGRRRARVLMVSSMRSSLNISLSDAG